MESIHTHNNMEFQDVDSTMGTFWSPDFEADSFNAFVSLDQGDGTSITSENASESRRKLAMQLLDQLEVLESSQKLPDEPYWLEEPMDLEVFGQSLIESSSIDDPEFFPLSPGPSSPLVSQPPTPIQPTSPHELYPSQGDLFPVKIDEPAVLTIPAENEEILDTLESLLHEIEEEETVSIIDQPVSIQEDEDITSALLDSLINGHVAESQVHDELAEFITLMSSTEVQIATVPAISVVSIAASPIRGNSSETSDAEWTPRPSGRNLSPSKPNAVTLRKPRKKSLKADDRRLRKKEQNKTAATRYRIKKKAELDILLEEEACLEQRNRQLQNQHDELANEVRYLKKLMRELFSSRKRN